MGLFAEALRQRTRDPEVVQLINSINGVGRRTRRPVLRAARHHPDRHRWRRAASQRFPARRGVPQDPAALRADRVREGPDAAVAWRPRHATPTRCWSSASCATWWPTRSATPTTAACWCARARVAALLLQVWDTGVGIAEADRDRVFEEFLQVHDADARSMRTPQGAGPRAGDRAPAVPLMSAPLAVRSHAAAARCSRSSAAGRPRPARGAGALERPMGVTLIAAGGDGRGRTGGAREVWPYCSGLGGQRDGLRQRAGVPAVGAGDGGVDAAGPHHRRLSPRRGRTGIDALVALRGARAALPAIVVTGSTPSGHEAEAHEHDFHLLIKPVLPNKLRAMIAFKLGALARGARGAEGRSRRIRAGRPVARRSARTPRPG